MGYQVIRQPDGKLAVWSSHVDALVAVDASPSEVMDFFVGMDLESTTRSVQRVLDAVLKGQPRDVYYQFTMTFDEALERESEHHGDSCLCGGCGLRPGDPLGEGVEASAARVVVLTDEQRATVLTTLASELRRAERGIADLQRCHGERANVSNLQEKVRRLRDASAQLDT